MLYEKTFFIRGFLIKENIFCKKILYYKKYFFVRCFYIMKNVLPKFFVL